MFSNARVHGDHFFLVLALRVYLTDIDDKSAVSRARTEVFSGAFRCSTLVQVAGLADPGVKVEIEAQGIRGSASVA
jgi:enamine deaminase RidA (YjgF/YER057c/UK114 family)